MKYCPSWKGGSKRSGVSDIIGNLLILAITVTLFSSVLFYVNNLPGPEENTYADFEYQLTPGLTTTGINVTKTGGETLYNSDISIALIINDAITNFNITEGGVGSTWDLGEKWSIIISQVFDSSDTVEMMVIDNAKNNVVWDSVLLGSGSQATYAPVITAKGMSISPAYVGDNVSFYCRIVDLDGDLINTSVTVDLSSLYPAQTQYASSIMGMTYNSATGLYVSNHTLLLTAASDGTPNWNGDVVVFSAKDAAGNVVSATYSLVVYKQSGGGSDHYGPYWDWTSYLVNGTYPTDATGGESSGAEGGVGTTFYYIMNGNTITNNFVAGDTCSIIVYSNALVNLALMNEFYIFHPITGDAISPQTSTSAFSYTGIYGTFYCYTYNFTVPSSSYIYPIQFKLKDNYGTTINICDSITVGGVTYPELITYKYVSSTSMVKTSSFNHTNVLYLQIKTKDVDLSASTLYVSDVTISDYTGRYIIKAVPGTYTSTVTYTSPISSVFKTTTTSPAPYGDGTKNGYYTFYIGLDDAEQGWWLSGTNAYTIKISAVTDQGTGSTTGEVYYSLTTQINVTAPLSTTDIVASTGSGSFTWSATGASWEYSRIAWYSGGEQWDETTIDNDPNSGPIGMALSDIDGDGDLDLVVGFQDQTYANIVWYENQKSDGSTWSSARAIALPFDALSGTQASGSDETSHSNIWEDCSVYSTRNGGFTPSYDGNTYVCTNELVTAIAVGDFDGDGDGDIAASYCHVVVYSTATSEEGASYSNSYGMYFNRGIYVFWNDGSWTKTTLYGTTSWITSNTANDNTNPAALSLAVGDFNLDGCDDIAAAYTNGVTSVWVSRYADTTGSVATREAAAFGTVSSLKTVPTVSGITIWTQAQNKLQMYAPAIAVSDMNNDGLPDIVRTSTGDNSVSVFYTQTSYSDSVTYSPTLEFSLTKDPAKVTGSQANLASSDSLTEVLTETYQNYTKVNGTVSAKSGTGDTTGDSISDLAADDGLYYTVSNGKVMYLESFSLTSSKGTLVSGAKLVMKYTTTATTNNYVYISLDNGLTWKATTILPTGTGTASIDLMSLGADTYSELVDLDIRFANSNAADVNIDYVMLNVTFVETRSLAHEWCITNVLREYHTLTVMAKVSTAMPAVDGFLLEYSVDNETWFTLGYLNSTAWTNYTYSLTFSTNSYYYLRISDTVRTTSDVYNDTITLNVMTIRHFARTSSWDSASGHVYYQAISVGSGEYITALAIGDMGRISSPYTVDGLKDIVIGTTRVGTGYATGSLYIMMQSSSLSYTTYSIYTTEMAIDCPDNSLYEVKNIALGDTDGDGDLDVVVVVGAAYGRDPGTGPTLWVYENNGLAPSGTSWQYGESYINTLATKGQSAINVQTGNVDLTILLPAIGVLGVVVTGNILRKVERNKK